MVRSLRCAVVVLVALASSSAMAADVDGRVVVQGTMLTSGGTPANGTYDVTFRLFTDETGGTEVFAQAVPNVVVSGGLFDTTLGPIPQGPLTANAALWLEAVVEGTALPRRALRATPYSLQAQHANIADLALDLSCSGCVAANEVGFGYAASASKGGAALDLACSACVDAQAVAAGAIGTAHLQDAAVTSAKVAFPYAGASTKGGAALDLGCAGCVSSGEVDFNFAASASKGGAASDVACTSCIAGAEIANGAVGSAQIADGSIAAGDVAFNYAGASTKGGAATDLACNGCVASGEVAFGYAASASKGGAASDLACTGCVVGAEIASGSISTAHLADGAVTSAKVGFNYAASGSKGGAATDLACTGCVAGSELAAGAVGTAQLADGAVTSAKVGFNYAASGSKGGAATDLACSGCVSGGELASNLSLAGNVAIAGSVQMGDNASTCNSGLAGAIRWSGTAFEGCNGTAWVELGAGGSSSPPEGPYVASAVGTSSQAPTVTLFTIPGKTGKRVSIQKIAICGDSDTASGSNRFAASGTGLSFSWEAGQNSAGATYHLGATPSVGGSARGFVYKDVFHSGALGAPVTVKWDYHNDWDGRYCQAQDIQGNNYADPGSSVRAWVLYYYTTDGAPVGNTVFSALGNGNSVPKNMGTIPAVSGKRVRIKQIGICGDSDANSGSNRFAVSGGGFGFTFEAGQTSPSATYHLSPTPTISGSARGFSYKSVDLLGNVGQGATVTWDYHNDWDGRYCQATDVYGTSYSDPGSSVRPWIAYSYE